MIKKYKFNCPVVIKKLPDYSTINSNLLRYFDACDYSGVRAEEAINHKVTENYYPDSFNKLDFNVSGDFERPWVQYFLPHLKKQLKEIANFLWYDDFTVNCIWFQEYLRGNHHGWHIHGDNFTGVYYVKFDPKKSPKTEIIDPYNNSVAKRMDVKCGDLILFPSFFIHRAPVVFDDTKKVIISFNVNISKPSEELFDSKRISYGFLDKIKNKMGSKYNRL
jgi:hypothetical protein